MQQYTECNRSLLLGLNVPCRVGYVSPPAMAISFPKNKDRDYFKASYVSGDKPTRFQGGRALALQVNLNELRWSTLFLFFSNLNISTRHISSLNSVHDEVKNRRGMHKIVWIPVMEHWNEKVQKDFERLRAKMPWYTAQCFSPILDLKEKWRYKGKPILVVMNP
ncbi:protein SIEVE ELEMENT OCCLUSION B [Prunus yedoensis var. nudiflora]|uniref:Protein SIEVE ELEMENT OCCLUSION B n=1 Tax=Prunus yedoensis var. nudiflora TaxID=2094558 RepID=A0A314YZI8_PRUYE|nr:protein SIEVE ELEMENT OCCLUSION B [Prunus yedoensis var. nudiflora]